ncbi:MAG: hypothetical protein WC890_01310 [Candidatus Margulisiibacteriota bacterium]
MAITYGGWWKGFASQTDPRAIANALQSAKQVQPQLDLHKRMKGPNISNNQETITDSSNSADTPIPAGAPAAGGVDSVELSAAAKTAPITPE